MVEDHVDVVWRLFHEDRLRIDDDVPLPVVHVLTARYSAGEESLNGLNGLDILHFMGVPQG